MKRLALLLFLVLEVVGQTSCQTQRQIAAWEDRFAEGNPREEYAAYVKGREESPFVAASRGGSGNDADSRRFLPRQG